MVIVIISDKHVGSNIAQDASSGLEVDNRVRLLTESGYEFSCQEIKLKIS